MHTSFCADWGVSSEELEATPESLATMAYGSYMIDIGLQGQCSSQKSGIVLIGTHRRCKKAHHGRLCVSAWLW